MGWYAWARQRMMPHRVRKQTKENGSKHKYGRANDNDDGGEGWINNKHYQMCLLSWATLRRGRPSKTFISSNKMITQKKNLLCSFEPLNEINFDSKCHLKQKQKN